MVFPSQMKGIISIRDFDNGPNINPAETAPNDGKIIIGKILYDFKCSAPVIKKAFTTEPTKSYWWPKNKGMKKAAKESINISIF